jgi:hypothetical protein
LSQIRIGRLGEIETQSRQQQERYEPWEIAMTSSAFDLSENALVEQSTTRR